MRAGPGADPDGQGQADALECPDGDAEAHLRMPPGACRPAARWSTRGRAAAGTGKDGRQTRWISCATASSAVTCSA
jgi:hypothetical protein